MSQVIEHPLAAIADLGAEPMAKSQPAAHTHAQIAIELLDVFGQAESTQKRVEALFYMATGGLTCEEFDTCMADALLRAKAADKLLGWQPAKDAKGRDLYGPRQSSLSSSGSNARQVFGCLRLSPDSIVTPGPSGVMYSDLFPVFSKAYALALTELKRLGVNWKGQAIAVMEQAAATKKTNNAAVDIETAAKLANPQQPGETIEQWGARIEALLPEYQDKAKCEEWDDAGEKLYKALVKKHCEYDADAILQAALKCAGYEIA